MLNTVLYGPPGVGKTLVGTKLAKIWYSLGYLESSHARSSSSLGRLKDILGEAGVGASSSSDTTDDSILAFYIIFIFVMILFAVLYMGWTFYSRFGGYWTLAMIGLILLIIIIFSIYVFAALSSNDNSNSFNTTDHKNPKNSGCKDGSCPRDPVNNAPVNNAPVNNANAGGAYVPPAFMPPDDQVIKVVTRADFVDKYVGWTDKKTVALLNGNLGKVLFVDEAYSLVTDAHDSFGIEALTAINLFLSQHPKEIIIIFAGYKDLMELGLFSFQPGLRRRFMWQFDCNGYTEAQLFDIFKMQLKKKGWSLTDEPATRRLFAEHSDLFPSFGGDTERLTFFSELEHSRDFLKDETRMTTTALTPDHVKRGMDKLQENNIQDDPDAESNNPLANMMKLLKNKSKKQPQSHHQRSQYDYSDGSENPDFDNSIIEAMRAADADRSRH
jgi:energy-coupling factor transporter transmembrane protein EcfT